MCDRRANTPNTSKHSIQWHIDMPIHQAQYTMAHRHANTPNTVYNGTYLEDSIQKIIAAHYKLVFSVY